MHFRQIQRRVGPGMDPGNTQVLIADNVEDTGKIAQRRKMSAEDGFQVSRGSDASCGSSINLAKPNWKFTDSLYEALLIVGDIKC